MICSGFARGTNRRLVYAFMVDSGRPRFWRSEIWVSLEEKNEGVRIRHPEIIRITRSQMEKYADGPIFRAFNGEPWQADNFRRRFWELVKRDEVVRPLPAELDCCLGMVLEIAADHPRFVEGYRVAHGSPRVGRGAGPDRNASFRQSDSRGSDPAHVIRLDPRAQPDADYLVDLGMLPHPAADRCSGGSAIPDFGNRRWPQRRQAGWLRCTIKQASRPFDRTCFPSSRIICTTD